MPRSDAPIRLVGETKVRADHETLCLRLCQAMILMGESMTTQRDFLERANISRSNAFNLIRGNKEARPPSVKTITRLAAFCLKESPVPWSSEASRSIAESLLPALRSYSAWQDWRDRNLALVAFAESVCVLAKLDDPPEAEVGEDVDGRGRCELDPETVAGAAVVGWFVAYGDFCDDTPQSKVSYHQACARLLRVLSGIGTEGTFARWIQFQALSHKNALEWNWIPENERGSAATRKKFLPYFSLLLRYIEEGNPTLIAEHINALAFASRFKIVGSFGLLKDRLELAWRRHKGGQARLDYMNDLLLDSDFAEFRKWLKNPVVLRRLSHDMPTTIPSPTDRDEFDFFAIDRDGRKLGWDDAEMVWDVMGEPTTRPRTRHDEDGAWSSPGWPD